MEELFVDNCKRETVHYAYNSRSENGINRKYAGYHMNKGLHAGERRY